MGNKRERGYEELAVNGQAFLVFHEEFFFPLRNDILAMLSFSINVFRIS